jgi:RND superfamily putative drug exporter
MFKHIARLSVKYRWLILLAWIAVVPLLNLALPSLASVTKNDNSAFLPTNSQSQHAGDLAKPFGSGLTSSVMVISRDNGPLTTADNAAVSRVEQAVRAVPNVRLVRDQGVSRDNHVRQALVDAVSDGYTAAGLAVVDKIRAAMHSAEVPAGLSLHLTGQLATTADNSASNGATKDSTQNFTLIFIAVLLLLIYRSALAPIVTLLPAAVSLIAAQPLVAEATKAGLQISPVTQLFLIVLILGAGTDYGLFLVFRMREELRRGHEPQEAVVEALTKVGEAVTFSALTVGAALLTLLFAAFGLYRGLGPSLAIGLGVMLLAAITLLPALLAIFGRAVFWPSKIREGEFKLGGWGKVAESVIQHPVLTLCLGLLVLGALTAGLKGYRGGGFGQASSKSNTDSGQGAAILSAHFPASATNPQIIVFQYKDPIWNNIGEVATTQKLLQGKEFGTISGPLNPGGISVPGSVLVQIYRALGPPDGLPEAQPPRPRMQPQLYQLYRGLGGYVSHDGRTVQFFATLQAGASGSREASEAIPAARERIKQTAASVGATDSGIFSRDAFEYDVTSMAQSDLKHIVPIVLLIIGLLLAVLLRSLVAPWYLILSVGFSYLATLGFAMIVFVHLHVNKDADGLHFILPFLLFVFSMALGEDYNILIMSRIREEAANEPSMRDAVVKAMGITGSTITSAGLILAGTFCVLGISGGSAIEIQQIAYSVAFGILLDTFFVRTLVVPSVAVMLGRWNWWPSALSRQPAKKVEEADTPMVEQSPAPVLYMPENKPAPPDQSSPV